MLTSVHKVKKCIVSFRRKKKNPQPPELPARLGCRLSRVVIEPVPFPLPTRINSPPLIPTGKIQAIDLQLPRTSLAVKVCARHRFPIPPSYLSVLLAGFVYGRRFSQRCEIDERRDSMPISVRVDRAIHVLYTIRLCAGRSNAFFF